MKRETDMAKAEEILEKHGFVISCHKENADQIHQLFIKPILEAMEEYASQSRPAVLMPEEEEIKQEAIKAANRSQFMSNWIYDHKSYEEGYLIGAKWALSQVQAIDGRELIKRYAEWWDKKYAPARLDFHRKRDIDAFLRDNAT